MLPLDNLIKNINALIEKEKISKAELARRAKMKDPAQLHNILSGRNAPGLDVMERLAKALRTNVAGLLSDDTPVPQPQDLQLMKIEAMELILRIDDGDVLGDILAYMNQLSPVKKGKFSASGE